MLSDVAVNFLKPLEYCADAERQCSILPLGGIYWSDEMPEFRRLFEIGEGDRHQILRLFGIRFKIWRSAELSNEDRVFWEDARTQLPDYPLFRRVELSAEDRVAQEAVEREALECFKALIGDADEFTATGGEHGVQSFSATYDLTKGSAKGRRKSSWWRRFFGRGKG